MTLLRSLIPVLVSFTYLACAAGPAPKKVSGDLHKSIRHLNKGTVYYIKGCYPKALQHIREAHERFAVADHLQGVADSLNTLANIYYRSGEYERALAIFDEAIALFEQLGEKTNQVRALANKSAALISAGRLNEASQVLQQADDAANDADMLSGLRLKIRALLRMSQNDAEAAEDLLVRALRATPESDPSLLAGIHYTLAHLMLTARHPQQAATHFNNALQLDRTSGAYFSIGQDLAGLGSCYENMARYAEAVSYYKRSLKIFALLEAPEKVQWLLPQLESCAGKAGLPLQATLHWTEQWMAGHREATLCR